MTNLFIVRHGETDYNEKKICQGQLETNLTKNGIDGAYKLASQFKDKGISFDHYFSSPLSRAYNTCLIIKDYLKSKEEIVRLPYFNERNFGEIQGKHIDDFPALINSNKVDDIKGYESDHDLIKRVKEGLEYLSTFKDSSILLVTHSNAIKAILTFIDPAKYNFATKTPNLNVTLIRIENDSYKVINENLFNNKKEDKTA